MLRPRHAALALVVVGALSAVSTARPKDEEGPALPPAKQVLEVVGFAKDGKEYVVKVVDENLGTLFQVRDSKKNELVKAYPFSESDEKRVWKRIVRAHEIEDGFELSAENGRKGVTVLTTQKGAKLQILIMKGEAIKLYDSVDLLATRKGEPAETFVKQAVWGPKGKHLVVVYHQKIKDLLEWEGDFVTSFKYRGYRVAFDGDGADADDDE